MADKAGRSDVAAAILKQLKDPFEPKLVKFRPGGGKSLAYIDARDVMKRLDDVLGTENWQDKYVAVDGGIVCELSLRIDGEWLTKSNGANNTKVEAVKGGISNALKRAAVNWGIGRYLYYMPASYNRENVADWDEKFLPGAPEDWEDIAELEAELDTGMDEEESFTAGVDTAIKIKEAETLEELKKIINGLDGTAQRLLADQIANKTDELTRNADSATNSK